MADKKAIRQQSLRQNVARTPVLLPTPYGKDWALDLLALSHNAVRIELSDMYKIYTSMKKRVIDISPDDFKKFFEWWPLFHDLSRAVLEMHDKFIYPLAEVKEPLTGKWSPAARVAIKNALMELLKKVNDMQQTYASADSKQLLDTFCKTLDDFTLKYLDFMKDMEEAVPPAIKKDNEPSKKEHEHPIKDKTEKAILKYIGAECSKEIYFSYARGIDQSTSWVKKHLGLLANVNKLQNKYNEHVLIVQHFIDTLKAYEKQYA